MKNQKLRSLVVWAAVLVVCILLNFVLPGTAVSIYTKALIMVLFALSLNIQIGYAGMMPLGHSTLLGVGAYVYTLMVRANCNMLLSAVAAVAASAVMGVIIGFLCLRGKNGMTFAFLSMGIATLVYTIAIQSNFLGRDVGLSGAKRPSFASTTVAFGVMVTVLVLLCVFVLYQLLHSPFARTITALRENQERLAFLGVDTYRLQLVTFVISSVFAGAAGVLYAMFNSGAYPTFLNTSMATQGMMMCLIGGMNTFYGPILGAAIVTTIITEVSNLTTYWQTVLGVIIIACVLFFRGGILGSRPTGKRKGGEAHE